MVAPIEVVESFANRLADEATVEHVGGCERCRLAPARQSLLQKLAHPWLYSGFIDASKTRLYLAGARQLRSFSPVPRHVADFCRHEIILL